VNLVLYSKPGCHLCAAVRADLARWGAGFEERDITTNAAWFERFQYLIPVLEAADGRMLEPPITTEALAAFVQGNHQAT